MMYLQQRANKHIVGIPIQKPKKKNIKNKKMIITFTVKSGLLEDRRPLMLGAQLPHASVPPPLFLKNTA
jgi:hypothetical protein